MCSHIGAERKHLKQIYGGKDSGESVEANSFRTDDLRYFQELDDTTEQSLFLSEYQQKESHRIAPVGTSDDLHLDIVSPPFQACVEDIRTHSSIENPQILQNSQLIEPIEERSYAIPLASLEILKKCTSKVGSLSGKLYGPSCETTSRMLSPFLLRMNSIIELTTGRFIQSNTASSNELSVFSHPLFWSGKVHQWSLFLLEVTVEQVVKPRRTCALYEQFRVHLFLTQVSVCPLFHY